MGDARISVAGIAVEGKKVFIARRVPGGAMGEKWEFPGGKVEEGESEEDALIREYWEEFRVSIKPGPLLGTTQFEHHDSTRTLRAYRIFFEPQDGGITLSEHSEWKWVSLGELETMDLVDSDRKLLPELHSYIEST